MTTEAWICFAAFCGMSALCFYVLHRWRLTIDKWAEAEARYDDALRMFLTTPPPQSLRVQP